LKIPENPTKLLTDVMMVLSDRLKAPLAGEAGNRPELEEKRVFRYGDCRHPEHVSGGIAGAVTGLFGSIVEG
jgi:hypothetical protein